MDSFLRIYMQRACTFVGCTPYYIYKGDDSRRRDIKSTHVDASCCITAVLGFKVAKFDLTDSNVKKTSFRDWAYNCPEVSFHRCRFNVPSLTWVGITGAKVNKIYETAKFFSKKIQKMPFFLYLT